MRHIPFPSSFFPPPLPRLPRCIFICPLSPSTLPPPLAASPTINFPNKAACFFAPPFFATSTLPFPKRAGRGHSAFCRPPSSPHKVEHENASSKFSSFLSLENCHPKSVWGSVTRVGKSPAPPPCPPLLASGSNYQRLPNQRNGPSSPAPPQCERKIESPRLIPRLHLHSRCTPSWCPNPSPATSPRPPSPTRPASTTSRSSGSAPGTARSQTRFVSDPIAGATPHKKKATSFDLTNACFRDEGERKLSFFLLAGKKGPPSTETTPPPPLPCDCPSFLGKEGKYRAGRGDWPAAGGSLSKREAAKKRASRSS